MHTKTHSSIVKTYKLLNIPLYKKFKYRMENFIKRFPSLHMLKQYNFQYLPVLDVFYGVIFDYILFTHKVQDVASELTSRLNDIERPIILTSFDIEILNNIIDEMVEAIMEYCSTFLCMDLNLILSPYERNFEIVHYIDFKNTNYENCNFIAIFNSERKKKTCQQELFQHQEIF